MSGNKERIKYHIRGPLGYRIRPCSDCDADKWIFVKSIWGRRKASYTYKCSECGKKTGKLYLIIDLERKGIVR